MQQDDEIIAPKCKNSGQKTFGENFKKLRFSVRNGSDLTPDFLLLIESAPYRPQPDYIRKGGGKPCREQQEKLK